MYWFAYGIIVFFAIVEFVTKKQSKILYVIAFSVLTLMICLRYGQGMDYFSYYYLYYTPVHGEAGYTFLTDVFRYLNVPFDIFIIVISLFMMIMMNRFLKRYSNHRMLSLVLFYPTMYLTYYYSALRQAIAMAFFLGIMLEWLEEDRYIRYLLGCVVVASFHSSSIVVIVLLIAKKMPVKVLGFFVPLASAMGIAFTFPQIRAFMEKYPSISLYMGDSNISVFGLLERVCMFGLILFLYMIIGKEQRTKTMTFLLQIYMVGFMASIATFPFSLISSRIGAPFKAVEFALFPLLIYQLPRLGKWVTAFIMMYTALMLYKNINAYISQTNYNREVTVFNYPYVTIFNKEDTKYYLNGYKYVKDYKK